eukprot:UN33530
MCESDSVDGKIHTIEMTKWEVDGKIKIYDTIWGFVALTKEPGFIHFGFTRFFEKVIEDEKILEEWRKINGHYRLPHLGKFNYWEQQEKRKQYWIEKLSLCDVRLEYEKNKHLELVREILAE